MSKILEEIKQNLGKIKKIIVSDVLNKKTDQKTRNSPYICQK